MVVPIMRLKDKPMGIEDEFKLFNFSSLRQLSFSKLENYLIGGGANCSSNKCFEVFEVEDTQNQLFIYTLIDSFLEYVGV